MSEYAEMTIRKLPLFLFRNYLDEYIVSLFFSEKDLIVTDNYKEDYNDEDESLFTKYEYKTTVRNAIERLEAQGFGINKFKQIFEKKKCEALDYNPFLSSLHVDFDEREFVARERIKKNDITYKKWMNSLKKIVTYELDNGNIEWNGTKSEIGVTTECDKLIFHSKKDHDSDAFYGIFPKQIELPYIFRLILEYCSPEDTIILNFSNIQYWDEDCIPKAIKAAGCTEKTIVLVEGKSDKDILEFAMNQIYPHLADLVYFMDFDDYYGGKRDGGTSFVVKNLKTFYFSKLKSKFLAIFDNDAEGYQSKSLLESDIKNWPDNFKILLYPEEDLFYQYPTINPNGKIIEDDINKKAASIELYLPDKLIQSNGEFYPIEWESRKKVFDNGKEINLYQGVISNKEEIKRNFHNLRRSIENNEVVFNVCEWQRMKDLLHAILFAYI